MKIRAKANGNVLDRPDEEAKALIATGIYEAVDEDESEESETKSDPEDPASDSAKGGPRRGRYARRDLRAEK